MIYFLIANLIVIIPIIYLFKYNGQRFMGINLSKKWVFGLMIIELIWLVFCWLSYEFKIDNSIANDFLWHNQFTYYRGVIPISLLPHINNKIVLFISTFLGAVLFDFILLRLFSLFKKSHS